MGLLKKIKKTVKGALKGDVSDIVSVATLGGSDMVKAGAGLLSPKAVKPGPDGSLSQEQLTANRPSWLSNMPTQGYGQQFAPKAGFDNPLFARLFGQQQMGQLNQQLGAGMPQLPQGMPQGMGQPQGQQMPPQMGQQGMQPPPWAQMPQGMASQYGGAQMGMAQPKPLYPPNQFQTQIQPPQPGNFFNPFGS